MTFFGTISYWQLPPFFPKFCRRKGIDKTWVGLVMSANAFSFLIGALFTGKFLLKYMKRIEACFLGALFLVSK